MNRKLLGMVAGTALLALQSTNASARADVVVGIDIGVPLPVVVASVPVHYHWVERAPVRYVTYRGHARRQAHATRYQVRCHERHGHGRHRGYARHR
jgi:hypothetical protein